MWRYALDKKLLARKAKGINFVNIDGRIMVFLCQPKIEIRNVLGMKKIFLRQLN